MALLDVVVRARWAIVHSLRVRVALVWCLLLEARRHRPHDLVHVALAPYAIVVLVVFTHAYTWAPDLHIGVLLAHTWLLMTCITSR